MPTVLRHVPFRFFFYAGDGAEPPLVDVERDECEAKFWLLSLELERSHGFKRTELNDINKIVQVN